MMDVTSLRRIAAALANERGHSLLVKGVRRLGMTKVIPAKDGPAPVHGRLSLEVGGYRVDFDLDADDLEILSKEGAKLA